MKVEVKKPCDWTCPKCGSGDIYRKHYFAGEKHDRSLTDRKEFRTPHIDFNQWQMNVKMECILHYCRVCSFKWTTEVLAIPDASEQPKEKTYTREEVAKVLCPYCSDLANRRQYPHKNAYYHVVDNDREAICFASDWLKATEKKGGEK